MKLLFVHDHKFRRNGNELYSTGGLNNEVLSRYAKFATSVTVIARVIEEEKIEERWSKITDEKVTILGNRHLWYPYLEREIKQCDKMIVRLPSALGRQALEKSKKFRKPCLIELVGCPWDALWNYGVKGKIIAPVTYLRTKNEVRDASWVLYVTNRFLQNRYPTRGKQIGCSDVVLYDFDENIIKERCQRIDQNKKEKVLGTIAAVDVRYKGQQYVIKALGILKRNGIVDYIYEIVGNGDTSYLRKIAKKYDVENQVIFLGGLPHEKVFTWLDHIDIYIQPSRQEGMPRALIEAMSRGLPAVGTNIGGIPELLPQSCLFEKSGTSEKEIVKLLKDFTKDKMLEQAKNNFKRAKEFEGTNIEKKREGFTKVFLTPEMHNMKEEKYDIFK